MRGLSSVVEENPRDVQCVERLIKNLEEELIEYQEEEY